MAYIAHKSLASHGAYIHENEIGRQLMKALQTTAIGPMFISSPPTPPHS